MVYDHPDFVAATISYNNLMVYDHQLCKNLIISGFMILVEDPITVERDFNQRIDPRRGSNNCIVPVIHFLAINCNFG